MQRVKVDFDPLGLGLKDDTPDAATMPPAAPVCDEEPLQVKVLDPNKLQFREKKSKKVDTTPEPVYVAPVAAPSSPPSATEEHTFDKRIVGDGTLWDAPSSKPVSANVLSLDAQIASGGLFDREDNTKKSAAPSQRSEHKPKTLNVGAADVEVPFDDLAVGKLLEREETLDYGMFGKTSVQQTGQPKKTEAVPKADTFLADISNDDLLSSFDQVVTAPLSVDEADISGLNLLDTPTEAPNALGDDFDINAYLSQVGDEKASGGGLFD